MGSKQGNVISLWEEDYAQLERRYNAVDFWVREARQALEDVCASYAPLPALREPHAANKGRLLQIAHYEKESAGAPKKHTSVSLKKEEGYLEAINALEKAYDEFKNKMVLISKCYSRLDAVMNAEGTNIPNKLNDFYLLRTDVLLDLLEPVRECYGAVPSKEDNFVAGSQAVEKARAKQIGSFIDMEALNRNLYKNIGGWQNVLPKDKAAWDRNHKRSIVQTFKAMVKGIEPIAKGAHSLEGVLGKLVQQGYYDDVHLIMRHLNDELTRLEAIYREAVKALCHVRNNEAKSVGEHGVIGWMLQLTGNQDPFLIHATTDEDTKPKRSLLG